MSGRLILSTDIYPFPRHAAGLGLAAGSAAIFYGGRGLLYLLVSPFLAAQRHHDRREAEKRRREAEKALTRERRITSRLGSGGEIRNFHLYLPKLDPPPTAPWRRFSTQPNLPLW